VAQIVWRSAAANALEEIGAYIRKDSPADATRVVAAIMSQIDNASDHPESGSIVLDYDDHNIRERLACGLRIIYRCRFEHDRIEIVLIQRQSRRLPAAID
jgi:plasmid stabilization system protein ParE